ncbi:MAG: T9SS type A sorting domain-containing protein [Fibrobacter sp.]|nr:T9SS type A sorting domain-containing protein [Fibrobacter sp.]
MKIKGIILCLFFSTVSFADLTLWYNKAATKFEEALPIGNGRLGGMVYGVVAKDRISLNESTVWNMSPGNNNRTGAANRLAEARQKIFANDATGACNAVNQMIGGGEAAYQPVGNLYLEFTGHNATNYRRELDLKTAISKTTYSSGGVNYTREYFASFTDQVIVVRLTADQPGKITCAVSMDCPHGSKNFATSGNDLLLLNTTVNNSGIKFQARVKVKSDGGTVSTANNKININGADSATVLIAVGTNFNSYNDVSANQATRAEKYINDLNSKSYDKILADHLSSYKELFDRVDINLGTPTNDSTLTTDAQVQKFATSNDPQLVRLHYQFGRYLIISSSRGESQPANLQGVWNESQNPSWGSKYTININTEMNYWLVESANLQECLEPLVRKIKAMAAPGKETARQHWGTDKGWVAHHNTDLWNRTAPIDGAWGHWPTGGAWLATHFWEHYLFTLDKEFLADVYETMKGTAEFFLATMVEEPFSGNKYLGTCPSASPENKPGAWNCDVSFAPTMDVQIIRDILNYTIEASKILNVDSDLRTQAEAAVKRLPPNMIGKYGQLQEWFKDWDNPNDQHRHVSHLYGLFPSAQITVRGTPELAQAAKTTLTQRGDMATGWSLAWKMNLWARLEDGNHAYRLVQMLLTPDRTYANLFDAHPPFQIDGNFGAVSGVNEMLLQSHNDEINFLPALPDRWSTGSFRGLLARKGFLIDTVTWSNKTVSRAVITSNAGGTCNVRHKNITKSFETEAGMTYVLDGSMSVIDSYNKNQTGVKRIFHGSRLSRNVTTLPVVSVVENNGRICMKMNGEMSSLFIQVYNLSGRVVYSFHKNSAADMNVNTPQLKKGVYLVNVRSRGLKHYEKVILK